MPFPELPAEDRLEHEVLERWDAKRVPERALKANPNGPAFVFYEGPPTANGKPAIHHVFARTLKDAVCRHRQMTGHRVPRKAGWDTQGLPVEIEVQKQQGITHRDEIEKLGIAEFNKLCRDSVFTYKGEWERLSQRMAYWLDYEHPYVTYESDYIQSCWAILARFHRAGLLVKDHKILPFCPQCSTGLSNHEVAQGYEDVQDPSVFVRFTLTDPSAAEFATRVPESAGTTPISLLVWTTTPWTLPSNVAVALDPALEYVLASHPDHAGERFVLAGALAERVLGDGVQVLARFVGEQLLDLGYQRPFDDIAIEFESDAQRAVTHTVRAADFVSADDGTGLVHMAPAFGADDFSIRQRDGLPLLLPVDEQGRFTEAFARFAGRFVKAADKDLIRDLKDRGVLFRQQTVDHSYPHCWRCRSPLLYMARPSWYLRTTELRDRLVALNAAIDWHPPEIGAKRFGSWLENNVDWAISRERYWGTPLNVWICDACGHEHAPESLDEIGTLRGEPVDPDFDPHRPQVDAFTWACTQSGCDGTARRTTEVIDCWFDSGAMPFAQAGWPRATDGELPADFPADFICEGLDQTRGWFYTLHVIGTFLTGGDSSSYKSVLVNNLLLDAQGKKMSKSRGNVVDPWAVFESCGADAARWAFLGGGQVWLPKRYDEKLVQEGARRVFGTLRNCYAFLRMYANLDGWAPGDAAPAVSARPSIDRWLVSRLETLTGEVGAAYEALELHEAARLLEVFLDEQLSNWYVRRNRARFWKGALNDDKRAAFATLREALERLALLFAPAVPFLADWLWAAVSDVPSCASVHLSDWPSVDTARIDVALEADMDVVLRAVELGRSVRAAHDLRTRQPLARVLVKAADPADAERLRRPELAALVAEELNVKAVEVVDQAEFRVLSAKPDFRALGPRFGKRMKALAGAVAALDEAALEAFEASGTLSVELDGEPVELGRDDVQLVEQGREGYAVAGDRGLVLALDTQLSDALLGEGRAREIVSRVQSTRKSRGLDVADRVLLQLAGDDALMLAARTHERLILDEVLGTSLEVAADAPAEAERYDVDGAELYVAVTRTG